uniref:Pentatricopeptide repeat-containing protein 2 n=1 Tax=Aceria tosichella TaxID=561515 RepID=A0A6G1SL60_9ACAR
MSRVISCYGLVSSLRMQTLVARPFSLLASSNNSIGASKNTNTLDERQRTFDISSSSRNLYTDSALGIRKLDRLQDQKSQLFTGQSRDRYIERLNDYLKAGDVESIYKDDLVNLIGIANTEQDLDLIEQIVSKSDPKTSPFFQGWGALLMRLYYKMNQLDRAYKNVKDVKRFGEFFNLRSCYKVLMTMLYDAKRYDTILEIFHLSQERLRYSENIQVTDQNEDDNMFERDLSTIAFAALAKINNQDALKQAEVLYNKLTANSRTIGLRPSSCFAYIACSNDQPKLALNLISNTPNRNYISLRELKIVSLIKLGRYDDILLQLREYVANIKRESNLLLRSTYDIIQENLTKIQDDAVRQELNDLLIEIKENGHVSETTIEELIFKPIDQERPLVRVNTNTGYRPRFNDRNRNYNNYNNDRYQGDRERSDNNRYQSRPPPRNQYGQNQYNNQQRSQRRYNDDQDVDRDDNQGYERRGDDRRAPRRFTYQNMNLD